MKALLTINEPLDNVDIIGRITKSDLENKYDCVVYILHCTRLGYAHFDIKVIDTGVSTLEINPN